LTGKDLPRFTQKKVRAYNPAKLGRMFEHVTEDQADLLYFFFCTGAREQEAQFACWPDVGATYSDYRGLARGFKRVQP